MRSQLAPILLAIILALTFQPLRRWLEKATDRIFFRDRYDTQTVLSDLGKILTSERDLDHLLVAALKVICRNLRINSGQLIVLDAGRILQIAGYGRLPAQTINVTELQTLGGGLMVTDQLDDADHHSQILIAHELRLSLPLRVHNHLIGFLVLGDKRSGSTYSHQDLGLLSVAAPELAVAISNAEAYTKIAQFNATLKREILQATTKLRAANRNLRALDKVKDEFLAVASHQLRTPLTIMEGSLDLITNGDMSAFDEQQRHNIQIALTATGRMAKLITELLTTSALNTGRLTLDPRPVDLTALVTAEVNVAHAAAAAKGLKLTFSGPPTHLPQLCLDEDKTRQAIANLLDNAIQYTPEGRITVTLRHQGGQAQLTITDTGIGVPAAQRRSIFTQFYRGDNARLVRPDGTGVGLYLVKWIIEAQGGKLIFASQETKGSTFGFSLPFKPCSSVKSAVAKRQQVT